MKPPAQNAFLPGVIRIERNARFRPSNLRTAYREFDFHGLCQADNFAAIQSRVHSGSTAGSAASQRIDNNPPLSVRFGVLPLENNFWLSLGVSLEHLFHDHCMMDFSEGKDKPFTGEENAASPKVLLQNWLVELR